MSLLIILYINFFNLQTQEMLGRINYFVSFVFFAFLFQLISLVQPVSAFDAGDAMYDYLFISIYWFGFLFLHQIIQVMWVHSFRLLFYYMYVVLWFSASYWRSSAFAPASAATHAAKASLFDIESASFFCYCSRSHCIPVASIIVFLSCAMEYDCTFYSTSLIIITRLI